MSELKDMIQNQVKKEIKYKDKDGKEHKRTAVLQEPNARTAAKIVNQMSGAGGTMYMGNVMELVMANAIVSPKLNYEELNKDIPEELQTKDVELTNGADEKVTLHMKFPDWRTALNISNKINKNDGSQDFDGTLDAMLNNFLFESNEKGARKLTWDWFDKRDGGYGLMYVVSEEVQKYIAEVTGRNGVLSILIAAFQLSIKQIRRAR